MRNGKEGEKMRLCVTNELQRWVFISMVEWEI